ncbi:hypothetical protein [Tateyamaria sp. Alg231-49]|uniref:hypothetical protein n=1 Tax=Tateyamaria sp. Alg231-49 TaxID=1922219 RepID=UPI000D562825|nr:hypothetical protein [Tateyamaria sp. Alg231-49]
MTINWGNLITQHPETGAYRNLSPDLLADAYLAPRPRDFHWDAQLGARGAPWSESSSVAPREVQAVVEKALYTLLSSTSDTQLSKIDPLALPEGRARQHLTALIDLVDANDALSDVSAYGSK